MPSTLGLWVVIAVGVAAIVLIAVHQFDRRRLRAYSLTLALIALILLLSACAALPASLTPGEGRRPLSRLTVHNQHDAAVYLRANWVEGMEQISDIRADDPLYISGSIAGGFPALVEILDADCGVIGRVAGQHWETQAMITASAAGLDLTPITAGEPTWQVAEVVKDCRTKPDLP